MVAACLRPPDYSCRREDLDRPIAAADLELSALEHIRPSL
jgi:hypothetical protein